MKQKGRDVDFFLANDYFKSLPPPPPQKKASCYFF